MTTPEYTYIYGLIDPRNSQIRYIGKADNPTDRYKRHFWQMAGNAHKVNWLRSMKNVGIMPDIEILEKVPYSQWKSSEIFWISYYRYIGADLTNWDMGGLSGPIYSPSDETRAKISAAGVGRVVSQETRKKISEANKGMRMPDSQVRATIIRMSGKNRQTSA